MHEHAMTDTILRTAIETAKKYDAKKVLNIKLIVYEHAGLTPAAFQMHFDDHAKGTLAEGAKLDINIIKPGLQCLKCNKAAERRPFSFSFTCDLCGGEIAPVTLEKDYCIENIEIE